MELKELEVQMTLVFQWGPELKFQPDLDWPIDLEPEVIDLDSDDNAIRGFRNMIIIFDDFD